jgi:hypothetical protein
MRVQMLVHKTLHMHTHTHGGIICTYTYKYTHTCMCVYMDVHTLPYTNTHKHRKRESKRETSSPDAPKTLSIIISSTALCPSSTLSQMITPLPAHNPLAFTTIGAPVFVMYALASSGFVVRM